MNTLTNIGFSDNEAIVIFGSTYGSDAVAMIESLIPEMSGIYVYITNDAEMITMLEDFNRSGVARMLSIETIWNRLDNITTGKFSIASSRLSDLLSRYPK